MKTNILDRRLSVEDQSEILETLFSFKCVKTDENDDKHVIIYDEEGYEFYGNDINLKYDLTNIRGIIWYAKDISAYNAIWEHNTKIKNLLNIR